MSIKKQLREGRAKLRMWNGKNNENRMAIQYKKMEIERILDEDIDEEHSRQAMEELIAFERDVRMSYSSYTAKFVMPTMTWHVKDNEAWFDAVVKDAVLSSYLTLFNQVRAEIQRHHYICTDRPRRIKQAQDQIDIWKVAIEEREAKMADLRIEIERLELELLKEDCAHQA